MNEINVIIENKEYQIDIEKARELGILKEKDDRCKSWKEFCEKYRDKYGFYYDDGTKRTGPVNNPIMTQEQLTENEAIAMKAFAKLLKLRRDWIKDWNVDLRNPDFKYCIIITCDRLKIAKFCVDNRAFAFPTEEMAKEFLECFKDLFEQCKNLI